MTPIKLATQGTAAMPETYFVTAASRRKACASEFGCPTVESALRTADAMLGSTAEPVWIVDRGAI